MGKFDIRLLTGVPEYVYGQALSSAIQPGTF